MYIKYMIFVYSFPNTNTTLYEFCSFFFVSTFVATKPKMSSFNNNTYAFYFRCLFRLFAPPPPPPPLLLSLPGDEPAILLLFPTFEFM